MNTNLLVIFALAATLLLYGCIGGTAAKPVESKTPAEVTGPSETESPPPAPVTEKPVETPAPSVPANSGEDVPPPLPE